MKRALLMSSSRKGNRGYLEHADAQLHRLFERKSLDIVFIPYAGVSFSFDDYEAIVKPVFENLGYGCTSIHRFSDPKQAIAKAQGIAIGGGNTFALLKRLYDADIVNAIKQRVAHEQVPYVGWSAGCNVATPSLRTTNDMPIVAPSSFTGLALVHFQMNPHFISGKPVGHNGESREERLQEFLTINPDEQVVAIKEGTALLVEGEQGQFLGEDALWFKGPGNRETIAAHQAFSLSMIQGVK